MFPVPIYPQVDPRARTSLPDKVIREEKMPAQVIADMWARAGKAR